MESIPKKNIDRLSEIAAKSAAELGLQILRLTARGTPSRAIIEVVLDGPKLVSIGDCEIVSRSLNEAIESESLISGNFRLDVLSPGLDEPLTHDYQFERTVGHLVEVSFEDGGQKLTVRGTLNAISPDEITVTKRQVKRSGKSDAGEEIHIRRAQLISAFARPDFG